MYDLLHFSLGGKTTGLSRRTLPLTRSNRPEGQPDKLGSAKESRTEEDMLCLPFTGRGENCVRPSRLPPEVEGETDAAQAGLESRSVFHFAYPARGSREKGPTDEPMPEGTSTPGRGPEYQGTIRLIMSACDVGVRRSNVPGPEFNCDGIRRLERRLSSRSRGRFAHHLNPPT